MKPKIKMGIFLILMLLLGGCSMTPRLTQKEKNQFLQSPIPYAKATAYSDALGHLGIMLEAYNHPSQLYVIQGRHVINKTACKNLPLDITDMMKTAVNKVGGNVRYTKFDPDYMIGEVQTGNPNLQRKLPIVVLEGAITECDENLDSSGFGVDADVMFGGGSTETDVGAGGDKEVARSRIALDLHLMDYATQTLIPRKQTAIAVDVWSLDKSYNFGFQVNGSGLGLDGRRKITQGKHDAVRILVELSTLQLLGRLFEVPYWRCIPGAEPDPVVIKMVRKDFENVSSETQISTIQALLKRHGYQLTVTGKIDRKTLAAIDQYATDIDENIDRKIGPDLYCHLFLNMPLARESVKKSVTSDSMSKNESTELSSDSLPIELHAALIYSPRWSPHPLRLRSGGRMMSGDRYKFLIMPEKDCFLYIFQSDAANQLSMLFPMESFGGVQVDNLNPVKGQSAFALPGPESSFILDKQKGIERIYVIAAPEADTKLEELGRRLNKSNHETACNRIGAELIEYLDTKELTRATLPGATFTMDGNGGSEVKIDADKLQTSKKRVYLLEFEHR